MPAFDKRFAGQPFAPRAEEWNAFIDAARAHRDGIPGDAIERGRVLARNAGVCKVQNIEGTALDRFAAVALGEPLITPDDNEDEYLRQVTFECTLAQESDLEASPQRIAILLVPLAEGVAEDETNGAIGEAVIDGVVPCRVDITTEGDRYAALTEGETYLTSQSTPGPVEILWPTAADELGTGEQWCTVRLGGGGATGGLTVEDIDSAPSYTSIAELQFNQGNGFVITNPTAGTARVDFQDASATQVGKVNVIAQSFQGTKTFESGLRVVYETNASPTDLGLTAFADVTGKSYLDSIEFATDNFAVPFQTGAVIGRHHGQGTWHMVQVNGADEVHAGWFCAGVNAMSFPTGLGGGNSGASGAEIGYGYFSSIPDRAPIPGIDNSAMVADSWVRLSVQQHEPTGRAWAILWGPSGFDVHYRVQVGGTTYDGASGTDELGTVVKGGIVTAVGSGAIDGGTW